jgi:hypothetical protein
MGSTVARIAGAFASPQARVSKVVVVGQPCARGHAVATSFQRGCGDLILDSMGCGPYRPSR